MTNHTRAMEIEPIYQSENDETSTAHEPAVGLHARVIALWARRRGAARERAQSPGYGTCYRCERPWSVTSGHSTMFEGNGRRRGRACFPLCEDCWGELDPAERLPFYEMLFADWQAEPGPEPLGTWHLIRAAVLDGR